jgi:transcriptional regulator with XRE-family HTH domain
MKNTQEIDVRELRKRLGLSQSELAGMIGVHLRTVQNYEKGKVIPKVRREMLSKIGLGYQGREGEKDIRLRFIEYRLEIEGQFQALREEMEALRESGLEKDRRIDGLLEQNAKLIDSINALLKGGISE